MPVQSEDDGYLVLASSRVLYVPMNIVAGIPGLFTSTVAQAVELKSGEYVRVSSFSYLRKQD